MTERVRAYPSLHRYFLRASANRKLFYDQLEKRKTTDLNTQIYMELWYCCLYVVIEGWRKERLSTPAVTACLRHKAKVERLREFRNALLHYDAAYTDPRVDRLLRETGFVAWVATLHMAISEWFLSDESIAGKGKG